MRRAQGWTVVIQKRGGERIVGVAQPGSLFRGNRVFEHGDETLALMVAFAISKGDDRGGRRPLAGTPVGARYQARKAATGIIARWTGSEAHA